MTSRGRDRGAVLLAALMLTTVMLLLGLGFLGQRRGQYRAAREFIQQSQAGALADAGLEDALGKLAKDVGFPPLRSNDQGSFTYSEDVADSTGQPVGSYRVAIDMRYSLQPYAVIRVTSRGLLGNGKTPTAVVSRTMEIDMAPERNPFRVLYVTTNEE